MADLVLDTRMRQLDRKMKEKVYTLQVERDTRCQMQVVKSNGRNPVDMAKLDTSLDRANRKRKLTKQQALDKTLQILTENPDTSPTEIAGLIGRSRQTIYDYLNELAHICRQTGLSVQIGG